MTRILLPNLMFEEELSGNLRSATADSRRMVAEMGPLMGLLSDDGKSDDGKSDGCSDECIVLVGPDAIPRDLPPLLSHVRFCTLESLQKETHPGARFVPWGWSRQAILTGQRLRLNFESPDTEVVKLINSRQFSGEFDLCFPVTGNAVPEFFGRVCSSMDDVSRSLASFAIQGVAKWVIKANLSQAARNRLIGKGVVPDEAQGAWLRQRFDLGEIVYAEPWIETLGECGLQFSVRPLKDGEHQPEFDGGAEMLTDAVGRYRGSILQRETGGEWWQPAVSHCRSIADNARSLGFFGVIGMDCMLFRHPTDGRPWLRVCHDINGRCTMGRVALSLKRHLQAGEIGLWCHAQATGAQATGAKASQQSVELRESTAEKPATECQNPFDSVDAESVRIVQTSPGWIGLQPVKSRTALLISEDCDSLTNVARKILNQNIRGPFSSL